MRSSRINWRRWEWIRGRIGWSLGRVNGPTCERECRTSRKHTTSGWETIRWAAVIDRGQRRVATDTFELQLSSLSKYLLNHLVRLDSRAHYLRQYIEECRLGLSDNHPCCSSLLAPTCVRLFESEVHPLSPTRSPPPKLERIREGHIVSTFAPLSATETQGVHRDFSEDPHRIDRQEISQHFSFEVRRQQPSDTNHLTDSEWRRRSGLEDDKRKVTYYYLQV